MLRDAGLMGARLVVTLGVSDVARSAAFYARAIGLKIADYSDTTITLAEPWKGDEVLRLVEVPWANARAGGRLRQLVFGFGPGADVTKALGQVRRAGAEVVSHATLANWEEIRIEDPDGFPVTLALCDGRGPLRLAFGDSGLSGPIRVAALHVNTDCLASATAYWSQALGVEAERRELVSVLGIAGGHPGLVLHETVEQVVGSPLDVRAITVTGAVCAPAVADPDGLSQIVAA